MKEGPKKVLIVDDEEILTWIMSKTLSKDRKKYEVLVANDGNKAVEIMESVPIDLVITDIRMPGMSGLDLMEHIKEHHPETKVIIMTAYGNPDVQKEANERGCLHYLEKPFKIEDLRNLILEAIKVEKKGFVGQVSDLQLTDLIQLSCLGKMKTALSVSKEDQEGIIYFEDGEIVHAECGNLSGEEALYTILSWEGGDFTTISGAEPLERTIDRPWQELLIEAMRRKDEEGGGGVEEEEEAAPQQDQVDLADTGSRDSAQGSTDTGGFNASEIDFETGQPIPPRHLRSPDPIPEERIPSGSVIQSIPKEDIGEPSVKRPRSIKEKTRLIQSILESWIQETEEIQGASVVTLQGLTLASHVRETGFTGEKLGALTAAIYKVGAKGVRALRRGPLEELYLRGQQGTIHLYVIESQAILSVLAKPDANIGMVHIESREHCKQVADILGLKRGV